MPTRLSLDPNAMMHEPVGNSNTTLRRPDRPKLAEGGYEPVADVLFNELNVDAYFLEYDDERAGDFRPLRLVPSHKTVVVGLVTTGGGDAHFARIDTLPSSARAGPVVK